MVFLHRNWRLPFNAIIRWYLKDLSDCINSLSTSFLFIMFSCVILGLLFSCSMRAGIGYGCMGSSVVWTSLQGRNLPDFSKTDMKSILTVLFTDIHCTFAATVNPCFMALFRP